MKSHQVCAGSNATVLAVVLTDGVDGLDPFADKEAYLEYPGFELFGGGSFSGGTGPIGAQALSGDEFGYSGGKTLASPGKPKRSPWTKD